MEDELKRLESIIIRIDLAKCHEDSFENIYELMQKEYPDLDVDKDYIFKEARVYIACKKRKPKDKELNMVNYREFLSTFKSWILGKIQRIKHTPDTSIK